MCVCARSGQTDGHSGCRCASFGAGYFLCTTTSAATATHAAAALATNHGQEIGNSQLRITNCQFPIGSWQLWQICGQRAKAKYAANSRWPDTNVDVDVSVSVDCNGGQRRLLQLRCGQSGSKLIHVPWLIAANRGSAASQFAAKRERETDQEREGERAQLMAASAWAAPTSTAIFVQFSYLFIYCDYY